MNTPVALVLVIRLCLILGKYFKMEQINLVESLQSLEMNVIERPETPSTENSDCNSLNSSEEGSSREDNFHEKIQTVKDPLIINVKKATKFRDRPEINHLGVYPMRSNPRGLVLIIANNCYTEEKDSRPSAEHDETNLRKLFTDMGFKVITHFDLTGEDILNKVQEFSKLPELRRVDSAFVIISSHGSGQIGHQETEILGIDYSSNDYKRVVCTNIMNYFTSENCVNLTGKPKIFIFQTCRGKNVQVAIPRCKTDAATTPKRQTANRYVHSSESLRNYEDMLIVYSTIPGYVSYRDEYNGSWFIQILCEVFMNYAYKIHVQELFNMIDLRLKTVRTFKDNCQTPSVTSQGFNKYCFLNPGLFDDKKHFNGDTSKMDITFKCCPHRKANIHVCFECESVYHKKCAQRIGSITTTGKVKALCCSANLQAHSNEVDNRSFNETVDELKKVLAELKTEKEILKQQMPNIRNKDDNLIYTEANSKPEILKENEHLKQKVQQLTERNNELLTEKLDKKKKKCHWVKRKFGRVLKRQRIRTSNVVEPQDI
ncbi:hypothetical protein TKK_0006715 [Trichogramma kaykai]